MTICVPTRMSTSRARTCGEDRLDLLAARDVAIEPRDARLGERRRQRLLELLGAEALERERVRVALRRTRSGSGAS